MAEHSITPPQELVRQWCLEAQDEHRPCNVANLLATQAARWGADQELEACVMDVEQMFCWGSARDLRAARRPKPPSLKEQALARLTSLEELAESMGHSPDDTIRRALEALPE